MCLELWLAAANVATVLRSLGMGVARKLAVIVKQNTLW
jgi:hypothetical protein